MEGGVDNIGAASGDPSTTLFDLPYDALALIVAKLTVREQLALGRVCREARDLTAGAAMAVRLANALFHLPQPPRSVLRYPAYSHAGPYENVRGFSFIHGQSRRVRLLVSKHVFTCSGWGGFKRARITCFGFEHSPRVAVTVDMVSQNLIRVPVSPMGAERACAEVGVPAKEWEQWRKIFVNEGVEGRWAEDEVSLRFEVSAEGDVGAVSVAFRQGLAKKRAELVGKVLGADLKGVNASKASLLTQCFAECEDPGKAGLFSQASAKCEDASKEVQSKPSGEAQGVSLEESGVRVVTCPRPGPQNMQVDLNVR